MWPFVLQRVLITVIKQLPTKAKLCEADRADQSALGAVNRPLQTGL